MGTTFKPIGEITVLSFGGGVQSTAMLIASVLGKLPRPDVAIFADTQWEPPAVIEHVKFMTAWAQERDFEVCTITKDSIRSVRGASVMPLSVRNADGSLGKAHRQCTAEYKIDPIRKEVRRRLGYTKGQRWKHRLHTWLGITIDEAQRMKPSPKVWETAHWPLIEELNWNREDCKRYIESVGLPVPMKSSCIGCPYHSDMYFRTMKLERPEEWADVVAFDEYLRSDAPEIKKLGYRGEPFIHAKCIPLKEVYLQEDQRELFGEECSGYCEA